MQIKFSKPALKDLDNIETYIYQDNPKSAKEVVLKIIHKIKIILVNSPGIGRPGRVKNTREYVINDLPYIIPYRVKDGCLEILRIMHTSRKYPSA
jgi:toxin ParE1/3/4